MSKHIRFLAGAALLLAGAAHADTEAIQVALEPTTIRSEGATSASDRLPVNAAVDAQEALERLHPDARPPYVNGGHFGEPHSDDN